jgi:hypothetical protein
LLSLVKFKKLQIFSTITFVNIFPIGDISIVYMDHIEKSADIATLVRSRRKDLGLTQIEAVGLCGVGLRFLVGTGKWQGVSPFG